MKIHQLILLAFVLFSSCKSAKIIDSSKENFHLYLLMGQSNMAGRGAIEAMDTIIHPRVYTLNKEMIWIEAKDPIHFDKPAAGTGLGLTFGKIMANLNRKISIGLIPTAVGGSSINFWFQDSLFTQTNTYPYNEMLLRAKKAMEDGTLTGILWHQGESDTNSEQALESYAQKFHHMLDLVKTDLGIESIPVVIGELGYFFYDENPLALELNKILNQLAESDDCIAIVSAEGLNHKGDFTHFNSDSYHALGARYAKKMQTLQRSCPLVFKN